jgi:hypothetical protein
MEYMSQSLVNDFQRIVYLLDTHLAANSELLAQTLKGNQLAITSDAHEKTAVYSIVRKEGPQMVRRQANAPAVTDMHQYTVSIATIPSQITLGRNRYIHNQLLLCGQSEILWMQ